VSIAQFLLPLLVPGGVESRDQWGKTPLHNAAWRGHADVVKWLVDPAGANIHAVDENGRTPLLWAARGGDEVEQRVQIIQHLLAAGADPNARTASRERPVDFARDDSVRQLLEAVTTPDDN